MFVSIQRIIDILMRIVTIRNHIHEDSFEGDPMIISTVTGRIRIRARVLRSGRIAERVAAQMSNVPGVVEARPNSGAGCLVVTYEPDALDAEALEDQLEAMCRAAERAPRSTSKGLSRQLNRATKYGMLATLTTSLAYGYLGRKKAHIRFGAAFLVFAGAHLFRYRSSLIR